MFYVILIIVFIVVVVLGTIGKVSEVKQNVEVSNKNISLQEDLLQTNGITVSNDVYYRTTFGRIYWRCIVDDKSEKLHFIDVSNNLYSIPYSKIISCELLEDNQVSGQISRAIAGGVLAGGAGAIIGAQTAKQKVSSLILRVNQDDLSQPSISMALIDMVQEKSAADYQTAVAYANAVLQFITVILHRQKTAPTPSHTDNKSNPSSTSSSNKFDEIKKYKELLDMGIISQEEFEEKKKELLN